MGEWIELIKRAKELGLTLEEVRKWIKEKGEIVMIEKEDLKGYFDWLEDLRKSGLTNMLGARPYLQTAFPDLSDKEAKEILVKWLQSFRVKARDAE